MKKVLSIDYVSDIHLGFYLPYDDNFNFNEDDITNLIKTNILPKKKGDVLVVAGDICESIQCVALFLGIISKYYDKVFYVAGNHEYYLAGKQLEKYRRNSLLKIDDITKQVAKNDKIVFLDRASDNKGRYNYNGFEIAGDTLWYVPTGLEGRDFYLNNSNDSSRIIIPPFNTLDKIYRLNLDSLAWYEALPMVDLMITHVPPVHNPDAYYAQNSCYLTTVRELKAPVWIYGHDHEEGDFLKAGTRFVSNPWGYYSRTFPLKNIVIEKEVEND